MMSRLPSSNGQLMEMQPLVAGAADRGGAAGGGGGGKGSLLPQRAWRPACAPRTPMARAIARNLGLILTWYVLGTALTLYNKLLLGRKHGLLGRGAFPAPLLMSALQFSFQCLLAKAVFRSGLIARSPSPPLPWATYCRVVLPNGITTSDLLDSPMSRPVVMPLGSTTRQ